MVSALPLPSQRGAAASTVEGVVLNSVRLSAPSVLPAFRSERMFSEARDVWRWDSERTGALCGGDRRGCGRWPGCGSTAATFGAGSRQQMKTFQFVNYVDSPSFHPRRFLSLALESR